MNRKGNPFIILKKLLNIRTPDTAWQRSSPWIILLLVLGIGPLVFAQAPGPTFRTTLTKDLNRLTPASSFSKNDKIYLHTVWTGLSGSHEVKVLFIRPDTKIQETTRIRITVPPHSATYTTWAWLSFKKGLLNLFSSDAKFIGPWKAQLFLNGKKLAEYTFSVL